MCVKINTINFNDWVFMKRIFSISIWLIIFGNMAFADDLKNCNENIFSGDEAFDVGLELLDYSKELHAKAQSNFGSSDEKACSILDDAYRYFTETIASFDKAELYFDKALEFCLGKSSFYSIEMRESSSKFQKKSEKARSQVWADLFYNCPY